MKRRTPDRKRAVWKSLDGAAISEYDSRLLHDRNESLRDSLEEDCDFAKDKPALTIAGCNYCYVDSIVNHSLPYQSR